MSTPSVAVIIPTRGKVALVRQAIKSLVAAHDPSDLDIVVIEGGGTANKEMLEKDFPDKAIRWMPAEDGWGFSKINNVAAATSTAPYILLLNNDTISRKGFLTEMLYQMSSHEDVGIVGAKLLHVDGTIQHCGIVFRSDGVPYHMGWNRKDDGGFAPADRSDYFDAVTFACVLIRRDVWDEIGGMTEEYHFNYEDVDFCLKAREAGYRTFMAHRATLVHLESKSLDSRKTEKHSIVRNIRIFRDRWLTNGKMEKVTGLRLNKQAATMRDDRINLAFVPSGRATGVPWWRIELPSRKLAKKGLANIAMLYADMEQVKVMETLEKADVAVFQGFCQEWLLRIAKLKNHRPFRLVYDYDDHPLHISPYAQAYRWFGCQEVRLQDSKGEFWLWRDGESGFHINENMENRQRQLEILTEADMVTTSTMPLYDYFSTLNKERNVVLLQNYIDFDVYRHSYTLWDRRNGPVRIGWHGGDNHYHDVASVGPWLTEYVNAHDVQLVLFGAYYKSAFRGIDQNKVVEEDWVHVEAFPFKLATLGIDVAVVPLASENEPLMKFNGYKSSIKYLEFSSLRIPSLVVEGSRAYSICQDGANSLTYTDKAAFMEKLDRLCKDKMLRYSLGTRALEYVHEHFDLEQNIHRWIEAYEKLAQMGQTVVEPETAEPEPAGVPSEAVAEGAAG